MYNSKQQTFSIHDDAAPPTRCPTCNRELDEEDQDIGSPMFREPPSATNSGAYHYMAQDYFKVLESSVTGAPPDTEPLLSEAALNSGYYKRFFLEEVKVGSGGFGTVFLCKHIINGISLGDYAVKKVPVGNNAQWLIRVMREVRALETLQKHQNIINYKHSWLEYDQPADFGPKVPCLFILMEYANGGNLEDYIIHYSKRRKYIPENQIWTFFLDLCKGLGYLHHCGIIHRDLKPNLMMLSLIAKYFGTCESQTSTDRLKRTGNTGTVEYLAPEMLRQMDTQYDEKCDLWSLGVLLYKMCYNELPFTNAQSSSRDISDLISEIRTFRKVTFPSKPQRSPQIMQLMTQLLSINPSDRPSVATILAAPYVQKKMHELATSTNPDDNFVDIDDTVPEHLQRYTSSTLVCRRTPLLLTASSAGFSPPLPTLPPPSNHTPPTSTLGTLPPIIKRLFPTTPASNIHTIEWWRQCALGVVFIMQIFMVHSSSQVMFPMMLVLATVSLIAAVNRYINSRNSQ